MNVNVNGSPGLFLPVRFHGAKAGELHRRRVWGRAYGRR